MPSSLPPGPRLPRAVQTLLWAYRFAAFTRWGRRRYGRSYTVRIGGLPAGVVTTDPDVVRRLFTGPPLVLRHGRDMMRPMVGDRSLLVLEPAEHLERFAGCAGRLGRGVLREFERGASQ